jgi:hypothetical protein
MNVAHMRKRCFQSFCLKYLGEETTRESWAVCEDDVTVILETQVVSTCSGRPCQPAPRRAVHMC